MRPTRSSGQRKSGEKMRMRDNEIFSAVLHRRTDPNLRIDMKTLDIPELYDPTSPSSVNAAEGNRDGGRVRTKS
jgi:hypothetical protein